MDAKLPSFQPPPRCPRCGGPARSKECIPCKGRGVLGTPTGPVGVRTKCLACGGAGTLLTCSACHRSFPQAAPRPFARPCAMCGGQGWIFKAGLHQLAPYAGSAGRERCQACGGSGKSPR